MIEKRHTGQFIESLSTKILWMSGTGALLVLLDPVITLVVPGGSTIHIGGSGFSDQLKGAVVAMILVSGFAAVIGFWLGASNQGNKAQESVNSIAQSAAPTTALAVAAATGAPSFPPAPIKTDTVNVETATTIVTQEGDKHAG